MKIKYLLLLLTLTLHAEEIFQTSTFNGLMDRVYDGDYRYSELSKKLCSLRKQKPLYEPLSITSKQQHEYEITNIEAFGHAEFQEGNDTIHGIEN